MGANIRREADMSTNLICLAIFIILLTLAVDVMATFDASFAAICSALPLTVVTVELILGEMSFTLRMLLVVSISVMTYKVIISILRERNDDVVRNNILSFEEYENRRAS